tara:strand:+ start:4231 stop:4509 length:279 start_codon:yes stop_codon:yes gene_type:complete
MKFGVITDGINCDLSHALGVMDDFEPGFAELQFIGGKESGDLNTAERAAALELRRHDKQSVISFESVYHPGNGDFDASFQQNIGIFKEIFGA